jgi:guanylate kinase
MKKLAIVISSPSGGGKTTICNKLINDVKSPLYGKVRFSISATTRAKRGEEVDGRDYYFLSKEEFENKIQNGDFLEYAEVFGNYYGTLKSEVNSDKHIIFDIDVAGQRQLKDKIEILSIFLLPPSINELEARINKRGDLTKEQIQKRISGAKKEIEHFSNYDFTLINKDVEQTFNTMCDVIFAYFVKLHPEVIQLSEDFSCVYKSI